MARLAPRVSLNRNGTVTVSGVNAQDMRDILTAASIHFYETSDKFKISGESDPYNIVWLTRVHAIVNILDETIRERYKESYPWHNQPLSKEQRLRNVQDDKRFRLTCEEIFSELSGKNV